MQINNQTRRDRGKGGTALLIFSYPEPSVSLARRLIARRETREFEEIDFFIGCPVTAYIIFTAEILR